MVIHYVDSDLYTRIKQVIPILCVDVVVLHNDKVLLLRRRNHPAKGEWWTLGGRVIKGETLREAAERKLSEEIGLIVDPTMILSKPLGIINAIWSEIHTPVVVFSLTVNVAVPVTLDEQHSEYTWWNRVDGNIKLHPYVIEEIDYARKGEYL